MPPPFVRHLFLQTRTTCRSLHGLTREAPSAVTKRGGQLKVSNGNTRHTHLYSTVETGSNSQTRGPTRIKLSHALAATTVLCSTTYLLGLFAPPEMFQLINPRPAPPPLPVDSEEGKKYTEQIERELHNLDVVKRCRNGADADEWYETRPYIQLPPERMVNNFTAGALRGPGKIAVPPLVRARKDETEAWVFIHLGRGVCGHDGIVHGGLLATLLDEGCGRNAVLAFPSHVGVTANLSIDYKLPTKADQFVIMKTKLVELKGRKAIVHGHIEDLDGNILAQAKALFIEPKFTGVLNSAGVNAIFPTSGRRIAQMTGAKAREGQVVDEGIVEGAEGATSVNAK